MAAKGFYLSIEAVASGAVALLVLSILMVSLTSFDPPTHTDLANYKLAESAAHSLKADGTYAQMALNIDEGNSTLATTRAREKLEAMNLPGNTLLEFTIYDSSMVATNSYIIRNGVLKESTFSVAVPFTTNTTSKFGIARLRMGVKKL